MEINWLKLANCAIVNRAEKHDVTIKTVKSQKKVRIIINNDALEELPFKSKLMVGIAGNRLYFKFSNEDGFAVRRTEYKTDIAVAIRDGIERFIGEYTLYKGKDDLAFIATDIAESN